jgi:hypothetical protein
MGLISLPNDYLTNSMELSPSSEVDSRPPSQEITCSLWNPEVHYLVRKIAQLVLILSHMNSVHTFRIYSSKIRGRIQNFPDWVDNEITINTRWEATQRLMAAKLTRLTHKITIQLYLVAESCIISSSCSRRPVRKLLDTSSCVVILSLLLCLCLSRGLLYSGLPTDYVCVLSHACYMPGLHNSDRLFQRPNNIWWWVSIMKLFVNAVSSSFLLLCLSQVQIFFSGPCFQTSSMWGTKFHAHAQQIKL